jgi:hypothetical protein
MWNWCCWKRAKVCHCATNVQRREIRSVDGHATGPDHLLHSLDCRLFGKTDDLIIKSDFITTSDLLSECAARDRPTDIRSALPVGVKTLGTDRLL